MYQCSKYNEHLNVVNKKIKELREKNNLSLSELSVKLSLLGIDIPKSSLHKIEKGNRIIKDYELYAFAYIFHVTIDELFDDFAPNFEENIAN